MALADGCVKYNSKEMDKKEVYSTMVDRKNYSFYMPVDFVEKIEQVKSKDPRLKMLSRSQAMYFIISKLAESPDGQIKLGEEN